MSLTSWVLVAVALIGAAILLQPRLVNAPLWRAVVTPLASIIGSGFLVAGPILSDAAGDYAALAMLALCAVGYLFGAAIRFNIAEVEPLLSASPRRRVRFIEDASGLVLAFAYFISVAYYLNLFAAFGLRAFGVTDETAIRAVTSLVLLVLGIVGMRGGLKLFEGIEGWAVGLKLAVIGGLLASLAVAIGVSFGAGTLNLPDVAHPRGIAEAQVVLGLVILVQGFETSRYLGSDHSAAERIRTMRWAQWISTGIYVAFLLLAAPYFGAPLPAQGGETAIIDMLAPLGPALAPALTLAALASQLSAAVADLNGAGGLLAETPVKWLTQQRGYIVTMVAALALTWTSNLYEIITYASKAFVLYYGLQSLQAALIAGRNRPMRAAVFGAASVLAVVIVAFATPAAA
jgi:hypothetical protein